jgi:hypothetical protein
MQVSPIEIDREEARKRVEEFTAKRRRRLTEMDQALFRGYKALPEGLTLIDVNQAIKEGGHFENNYCPRLAIARSDLDVIHFRHHFSWDSEQKPMHGGEYIPWEWGSAESSRPKVYQALKHALEHREISLMRHIVDVGLRIVLEPNTIASPEEERKTRARWFKSGYQTVVPPIPFHLRPNGDASKYFILWEVEKWEEWRPSSAPGDPLLLERIAHPIYVVVAQWDLSDLEKRILESFRR